MADVKKIKIDGTWYDIKDDTARTAASNAMPKTGGSFSGAISSTGIIKGAGLSTQNSNADVTASTLDAAAYQVLGFRDVNDQNIAYIQATQYANGLVALRFNASHSVNGSIIDNYFQLRIGSDGTKEVTFSDAPLWQSKIMPDSGWKPFTNSSVFNSDGSDIIYYRKFGKLCILILNGILLTSPLDGVTTRSVTLGTIPTGYRPQYLSVQAWAGNADLGIHGHLSVSTAGEMKFYTRNTVTTSNRIRGCIIYYCEAA